MKKRPLFFLAFLVAFLGACQPAAKAQPVFTPSTEATVTPLPSLALHPQTTVHLRGAIQAFDMRPDQTSIAIGTGSQIHIYDLATFKLIRSLASTLDTPMNVTSVAWSPDGKKLAAGVSFYLADDMPHAYLLVWDTSTWEVIVKSTFSDNVGNEPIPALAWSPDNRSLAVSVPMNSVVVVDAQTGKPISTQQEFAMIVYGIAWSPDGTRLVAAGDMAKGLRRWKVSSDESVRLFDKRLEHARQLAWSPDGARIASSHWDGAVCFWTVATNTCDSLIQADPKIAYSLAWSVDGTKLATGGSAIRIWDPSTGKLLSAFGENEKIIYTDIQWTTPDQPLVTLQANDNQQGGTAIRLWDVVTGRILAEFIGDDH